MLFRRLCLSLPFTITCRNLRAPRFLSKKIFENQVMKYILVTGGVISGIGKGVIASSIGKILKSNGFEVTAIKIDPYINIDAGTFSPYEHGEVFVLDDGGEVDLDLGNYERFMDIKLHRENNITTGKIYQHVIDKEREGKFLGKTVQVVPHITDAIQEWVERVALKPVSNDGTEPEICIIELGGTIGDIEGMPFVEAFRQFQFRVKRENFCCVHVSLVPQPKSTGEHKTKPTQASVRELRGLGLSPDIIVCRSELPINESVKEKISNFCHVPPEQVICLHDVQSVYHVPIFMEEQGLVKFFHDRLSLRSKGGNSDDFRRCSREWRNLSRKVDTLVKEVKIALVGKYTGLEDAYASVTKALQHATLQCNLKLNLKFIAAGDLERATKEEDAIRFHEAWQNLCKSDGIIVPGGFGLKGLEGKIAAIEWARKNKKPFLGICLGFQLAVVEYARNCLGWENAHSSEIIKEDRNDQGDGGKNNTEDIRYVVIEMPEHHTGIMGGTMRLGKKDTIFKTNDSILWNLYGKKNSIEERHRHRYEVDKNYVSELEKAGLKFVGEDEFHERLEILELSVMDHPYFVAVQFHPEYISRPLKPSPPYLGLILASCGKLQNYLNRGCQFPVVETDSSDDEESSGTPNPEETEATS